MGIQFGGSALQNQKSVGNRNAVTRVGGPNGVVLQSTVEGRIVGLPGP